MSHVPPMPRSPLLMSPADTALLVIDVQEKLIPHIAGHARVVWNVGRLIEGAGILGVHVRATQQYPQGLGPTVAELAPRLDSRSATKTMFSCRECRELIGELQARGCWKLLIAGIETHVCVQQSVFDLMAEGFQVYVAVDAAGSRHVLDHEVALRRIDSAGVALTTTEAALLEWCEVAGTPQFKQISALVRQAGPP
jgi:nicotinamidase-related amidase